MDQKKIRQIYEEFRKVSSERALMSFRRVTCDLGLTEFRQEDLMKIAPNHVWSNCDGVPPYFIDLAGFELLYQFALEYEKTAETNLILQKQNMQNFLEKFGIKKD